MNDDAFMSAAMDLARLGRGRVEPNPMVGCVIVREGRIIGRGHHQKYGQPHAEPNALADCVAHGNSPAGATVYVTLEPCCHVKKQTPPCVPRLIETKVARVVIGCGDPNPAVNGRGVEQLRAAGIDVRVGVLEPECRQLIAPFIAAMTLGCPYVTLKWAQTRDGKIAGPGGTPLAISGEVANRWVHLMRRRIGAILVGIGTVLKDDPLLTARGNLTPSPCIRRFVLDTNLLIPLTARLITDRTSPTTLFHASDAPAEKAAALMERGVILKAVARDSQGRLDLAEVMRNIGGSELLVEPGPTLAAALFTANLADRLWIIHSPNDAPAGNCPDAAGTPEWPVVGECDLGVDRLRESLNPGSPLFFSAMRSPDCDEPGRA